MSATQIDLMSTIELIDSMKVQLKEIKSLLIEQQTSEAKLVALTIALAHENEQLKAENKPT